MMTSFYNLLKYAATGIASPEMTYFDKMRASMLMGGAVKTLTGIPPLSFKADGTPLISWSMKGNGQQQGTPTPDSPVMPEFVGTLDNSDWTIPITCGGEITPVYLGQVSTVRRIRKRLLTGTEDWKNQSINSYGIANFYISVSDRDSSSSNTYYCSHFKVKESGISSETEECMRFNTNNQLFLRILSTTAGTVSEIQQWLAAQYANGTPVCVWYVLAEAQTAIVNEPLCKIGTYADELHSEDAAVTIPTVKGANVLTVDTELQPSEMSITYKG